MQKCGLHWIGPQPEVMRLMGDKVSARAAMAKAGVPIAAGHAASSRPTSRREEAVERIGFPVIIKAAAGGGGRGMKIVESKARLQRAAGGGAQPRRRPAFGNPDVYIERYIGRPRHIEVQVLGDGTPRGRPGRARVLDPAPPPEAGRGGAVGGARRRAAREAARASRARRPRASATQTVGTLEFLLDEDKRFYFMEMNTRIQVEHTVTEEVFGVDLVREQMRLAAGEPLRAARRHAPARPRHRAAHQRRGSGDLRAVAGADHRRSTCRAGLGVRVDTHIYAGYVVPPNYDSLLAKLIVHAENRPAALARLRRALDEFVIEGMQDQHRLLQAADWQNADYVAGKMDTHLVERM